MLILPIPKQFDVKEGHICVKDVFLKTENKACREKWGAFFGEEGETPICLYENTTLEKEGYILKTEQGHIRIEYSTQEGIFRAGTTLKQMLSQAEEDMLCEFEIYDYPDIPNRAYMLDISRGKVPSLKSLKILADQLAALKYNQLQLYMDNFVYEYKNFPDYWKDTQPLTKAEIMELDAYCRERFIELVPNQNGFGHMTAWLEKEELAELAIQRDDQKPSSTLNPLDPRSLELVDKIYDGYWEIFSSQYAHIGMDEPFELGMGQTREACEKYGKNKIFTEYANKVCRLVSEKYKKIPMLWNDDIAGSADILDDLCPDAIILDCKYECELHFDRSCQILKEKGFRFYTCPGSSLWKSYTGRSYNAVLNIIDAVECAKYYGAEGSMLTEWGNGGNVQFPAMTYFTMAFFGAVSWNVDKELKKTQAIQQSKQYVDQFLFGTTKGSLADLAYDIGNYFIFEERTRWDRTELFNCFLNNEQPTQGQRKRFVRAYKYMQGMKEEFAEIEADEICKREVELDCDIVLALLSALLGYEPEKNKLELKRIKEEFITLWCMKNHTHGVEIFCDFLDTLIAEG